MDDLELDVVAGQVDDRETIVDEGGEQVLLVGRCLHAGGEVGDRGEHPDHGPAALHQGVGALSRGVADVLGCVQQPLGVRRPIEGGRRLLDAVEETLGEVVRCRQGLGEGEVATVPDANIGERATVVDVDERVHATPCPWIR